MESIEIKLLYGVLLLGLGFFFLRKMLNPPQGPKYTLKSIAFRSGRLPADVLGSLLYTAKGAGLILPTELDLWSEVRLYEHGLVLRRNKKEKTFFFSEIAAIEPFLVNSLFVKGKYYGYDIQLRNKDGDSSILLKSSDIPQLGELMDKLIDAAEEEIKDIVEVG